MLTGQSGSESEAYQLYMILEYLLSLNITWALIQDSKVGCVVQTLCKHPSELVSGAAKVLMEHWTRVIEQEMRIGGANIVLGLPPSTTVTQAGAASPWPAM